MPETRDPHNPDKVTKTERKRGRRGKKQRRYTKWRKTRTCTRNSPQLLGSGTWYTGCVATPSNASPTGTHHDLPDPYLPGAVNKMDTSHKVVLSLIESLPIDTNSRLLPITCHPLTSWLVIQARIQDSVRGWSKTGYSENGPVAGIL